MAELQKMDVMRKYEEALISAVEKIHNLEEVANTLFSQRLIPKDIHNNFFSLDPDPDHLDPALKPRYLLHVALTTTNTNASQVNTLIKALSSFREMKAVTYNLLKEINGSEAGKPNAVNFFDEDTDIVLEMHVNLLAEILQEVSHKWEEIGIALNLPMSKIEECRNSHTNNLRLYNILLQWYNSHHHPTLGALKRYNRRYQHLTLEGLKRCNSHHHPTLRALKKALKNEIVSEARVSEKFVKEFQEKIITLVPPLTETAHQKKSSFTLKPNYYKVSDGKSTILEATSACNESEKYHWLKNGEPLCDDLKYSGVCQKFLLIKKACQGIQGNYSCSIGQKEPTTLKVVFSLEKMNLLKFYKRIPEIKNDSWPPVGSSSFIKLALIKENRPYNKIHDDSVRGDMDDILKEKETGEYKLLFQKYEEGAFVLIEGRPGSGKTTLTRKMSKDWASKPDILMGGNLVFLISLRMLSSQGLTLSYILELYYSSSDMRKELVDKIEKQNGKGCCFIVDGLDEYQPRNDPNNLIHKILYRKYLHNSMVIVASRPIGSVDLRRYVTISKRIEVLGFSRESIFKYVDSYFLQNEHSKQKAGELKDYLRSHVNLLHMCYLPVHAAMICFIYQQPIEDIPVTETKMYEYFTLLTIKRKLECDGSPVEYDSLNDLDGDILESFTKVCKLAFEMTIQSKQTITLGPTLSKNGSDVHSLGLVTVDKTAKLFGVKDLYSFLHLTFQEFLTAYYICTCPIEEQQKIVVKYANNKEMLNVWKFFCGCSIFDNNSESLNQIMTSKHSNDLYRMQCAFEAQQQIVCDSILEAKILEFNDYTFFPPDWNALAYICNESSKAVTRLVFNKCNLDEAEAQIFITKTRQDKIDGIGSLSFFPKTFSKGHRDVFQLFLSKFQFLTEIGLENTEIGEEEIKILNNQPTLSHLRYLGICMPLRTSTIGPKSEDQLLNEMSLFNMLSLEEKRYSYNVCSNETHQKRRFLLKPEDQLLKEISLNMSSLEEIRYSYNVCRNETHQKCLFLLLNHFKCKIKPLSEITIDILSNLKFELSQVPKFLDTPNLVLVNCDLCDSSLDILQQLVHENLQVLQLDCNKITSRGTMALSQLIEKCTNLTHLSLSCNLIGSDGAITISNSVLPSSKLIELDLEGNDVGDEGALALAEAADKMQDNFILKLGNSHISHETRERIQKLSNSVKIKEESLIRVSKYVNLSLSHPSSAQRVMPCFEHLLVLNFSGKRISKSAFEELVNGLEHCRCLHTLNLSRCSLSETSASFGRVQKDSFNSFEDCILSKSLKVLDLSYNNLHDDDIECVAYFFRNIQIEILNLSNNKIGTYRAAALVRWLRIGKRIYEFKEEEISRNDEYIGFLFPTLLNNCVIRNGTDGRSYADGGHQWSSSLLELNLSGNKIGDEGAAALGYVLKYCQNLQSLNLHNTEISYGIKVVLMGLKECHALQSLNLDYIPLNTEQLWGLSKSIQHLSLNNVSSRETTNTARVLLQGLNRYCNLKTLNLENTHIYSDFDEVRASGENLKLDAKLVELRIGSNTNICDIAQAIIENNHELKTLHLQKNTVDLKFLGLLVINMRQCQLVDLNLSSIELHKVCGAGLLNEGLKHCPQMKILNLSSNKLDSNDFQLLSEGLQTCKHLVKLNLSDNKMDSVGATCLAKGINHFCEIKSIYLGRNNIGSNGAAAMMEALKNSIYLECVQLQFNSIGPEGASAVADLITSTSKRHPRQNSCFLRTLNLAGNQIHTNGTAVLAGALQFCKNLHFLDMSNNKIDSESADGLARGLQRCSQLHILYLDNNYFDRESAIVLAKGLKYCQSLVTLSLSGNKIETTDAAGMAERVKHITIKNLYLKGNNIDSQNELVDALPHCNIYTDLGLTNKEIRRENHRQEFRL